MQLYNFQNMDLIKAGIFKIKLYQFGIAFVLYLILKPVDQSRDGIFVWDAIHFKHIIEWGYGCEYLLAFFPGIPLIGVLLNAVFWYIPKVYLIVIFVNMSHLIAVKYLGKLGIKLGIKNIDRLQLMMMFTPQVMLLSTLYSEFPFAALTYYGIYALLNEQIGFCIVSFTIASIFRSNGVVNIGYLVWWIIRKGLTRSVSIRDGFKVLLGAMFISLPFILFQYYSHILYCPGRPWCNRFSNYSFVQKEYWDSGLFLYYTTNNIFNFALVIPIQVICLFYVGNVYASSSLVKKKMSFIQLFVHPLTPCIVQLYFYIAYGSIAMHVNTLLRVLSSNPAFYFVMLEATKNKVLLGVYCFYYAFTFVCNIVFVPPA